MALDLERLAQTDPFVPGLFLFQGFALPAVNVLEHDLMPDTRYVGATSARSVKRTVVRWVSERQSLTLSMHVQ